MHPENHSKFPQDTVTKALVLSQGREGHEIICYSKVKDIELLEQKQA